jgi:stearoyl-CoA desaturase (delta-9 desaturase)
MSKGMEKVFFIGSFITQGSSYLSPNTYGIMHRMHHAFADTEKDPHSPKFDKNLWKLMWHSAEEFRDIFYEKIKIEDRFKINLPEWKGFDRITNKWAIRVLWMAAYTAFYIFFANHWWMYFLLPIHFLSGPVHGAVINWFAHKYGYTNFKLKNTSKNLLPVDFLMLGEAYHNNHHKNGTSPNFGFRWFEIDPIYPVIKLFNALKIIKLKI